VLAVNLDSYPADLSRVVAKLGLTGNPPALLKV